MKRRKISLAIISILVASICMLVPNKSKAALPSTPVYFGVSLISENSATNVYNGKDAGKNIGYSIGNGDNVQGQTRQRATIWNIMQYQDDSTGAVGTAGNFYCIREGTGFRGADNSGAKPSIERYTTSYDFTNKSTLANIELIKNMSDDDYYSLLALSDILYLEGVDNREEYLAKDGIGIHKENYNSGVILTDSDMKAVQQAAIWYFSNHDNAEEFQTIYDNTSKSSWLFYTTTTTGINDLSSLSDYDNGRSDIGKQVGSGMDRNEQANILYRYLVSTAINNSANYKNGTVTPKSNILAYTNLSNPTNTQPIIAIERKPEVKDFDLALSKYITKVDGVELTANNSRVPNIDESTIKTENTATYKHRKDPVVVKNGSVVTYNITVYNEGEKAGRATKIIDQLPTGLKFKQLNTKGFTATADTSTNQVVITRDNGNETNLEAYTEGNLKSETIEIECVVDAMPDSVNEKILTNVAWIAEEYDAVDNVTITNQKGKDRDSEPSTVPNVNKDNMANYKGNSSNKDDLSDSNYYYKGQQDDDDFEKVVLKPAAFDLKLIKRIVEVNGSKVPERIESVDITNLANGTATTATYKINKDPVSVKKGDLVKYTFRVYNEGEIDGYASEISEDIPDGLEFVWSEKTGDELNSDTTLTNSEKEAIKYNQGIWDIATVNKTTNKVELIKTDYLAKGKGAEIETDGANLIKAFDPSKGYVNTINDKNPDYKEVSVYLKVVSDNTTGTVIRNEAAITGDSDKDGNPVKDRDSSTDKWIKYEDDEDYDNVKLQSFDLALRKFIVAVSSDTTIEDTDYLKNSDGTYSRAPIVDTSKLNTTDENGKLITTAIYNHSKEPVSVNKGDIVVYMLRVYNEGDIDGYASEVKDHLPSYLEFVEGEFNKKYGWTVSSDGRTVTTSYLDNHIIEKTSKNEEGTIVLSYKEVPIMCKVKDTAKTSEAITNIADVTVSKDANKNTVSDRDSKDDNVVLPADKDLPSYKDDQTGTYVPGQEDDDDFEKVIIKPFDLALRKFITGVNDKEVTSRIPQVSYDKENNKITYNHTKDPVEVVTNDTVIYTIRVFNEGKVNGYASKVSDDLPDGLEYLPDNEINKQYRWVMYDSEGKETTEVSEAKKITTDYLSKEQGEARMKENSELTENPALLKAFDSSKEISDTNPDYADVKVAFKVVEPNTSSKIIINSAQISDDTDEKGKPVDDIDSVPDKWNDGEDDQDQEKIKLTYFDLALRKWVTQAIVIENGKETVTQTGHTPEQDPEPVVKVELNRKKLDSIKVKFRYSIRVTNEGDIAGYAKEIKDYVPDGLKFVAADNKGWTDEGNNVISTKLLENKLLQPGESADVEVVLTWINGKNNLGTKNNIAEISKDYNDKGAHDIDSTPNNKVPGEDDQDDAPVLLSIKTGQARIYFVLGFTVLITLAGGIVLIKKFVL